MLVSLNPKPRNKSMIQTAATRSPIPAHPAHSPYERRALSSLSRAMERPRVLSSFARALPRSIRFSKTRLSLEVAGRGARWRRTLRLFTIRTRIRMDLEVVAV